MSITTIVNEPLRGCGYRKPGGLYLTSSGPFAPCGQLPIPLVHCRACGGGIKPARGFTWIAPRQLFGWDALNCGLAHCSGCPVGQPPEEAGLLWIGEKFYPSPADWTQEAFLQGVSRRITQIPRKLVVGETFIFVAHRKACTTTDTEGTRPTPGIFHAFRPQRIEYILTGEETEDQLAQLEKRGLTLIRLIRTDTTSQEDHYAA